MAAHWSYPRRVGRTPECAESSRSMTSGAKLRRRRHFVADDEEFRQGSAAEVGGERDIGGIPTDGHDDAADAGNIVPRIKGIPTAAKEDFEPTAEIHGQHDWHTDVAHVTGDVARGNVHATAEGEGEMAEIAADAARIIVNVERGFGGIGEMVTKRDVVVDPIADRLDAGPARGGRTEELPGDVGKFVDFAVSAREKEGKRFAREIFKRMLDGVETLWGGFPAVFDQRFEREAHVASRRENTRATVAIQIREIGERDVRFDDKFFFRAQVALPRGMNVQHQDHRRGTGKLELDIEADLDDHKRMPRPGDCGRGRYFRPGNKKPILWRCAHYACLPEAGGARRGTSQSQTRSARAPHRHSHKRRFFCASNRVTNCEVSAPTRSRSRLRDSG